MPTSRNPKPSAQSKAPQITVMPPAGSNGPNTGKKDDNGVHVRIANRDLVITRRKFLFGAAGVGAVTAAAVGANILQGGSSSDTSDIPTLSVDANRVISHEDCAEVEARFLLNQVGEYDLPFGSLVWVDDDNVGACLLPTETPSPLTTMALLYLDSGDYASVRESAVGAAEGFEIYDVRASSSGLIWTEANIFEGLWRLYCATLDQGMAGEASLLEEGDHSVETPSIAAVGDYCFWQIMPQASDEEARRGAAFIKRAKFNAASPETVFEAKGRFATPLCPCGDALVFTPRHDESSSIFQILHMDASSHRVDDQITLPEGMKPSQVGYGVNGFAFCFDSIYDFGGGIANLGTYTPTSAVADRKGNYDDLDWFRFGRTPLASPAWCGQDLFVVKSTLSVCAVDMANRRYCALDVQDGSASWGDYLVSSGARGIFATSMQIDYVDTAGTETNTTRVRLWSPVPAEERLSVEDIEELERKESSEQEQDQAEAQQ